MDNELSLVMANMALIRPGSVVLDPFVVRKPAPSPSCPPGLKLRRHIALTQLATDCLVVTLGYRVDPARLLELRRLLLRNGH